MARLGKNTRWRENIQIEDRAMVKRFIYWLYIRFVYLPELKAKIKSQYPGVTVSCKIKDLNRGCLISDAKSVRAVQKAQYEREWIPDDELN